MSSTDDRSSRPRGFAAPVVAAAPLDAAGDAFTEEGNGRKPGADEAAAAAAGVAFADEGTAERNGKKPGADEAGCTEATGSGTCLRAG